MMEIKDIANVYVCKYNANSQFAGEEVIIVQDLNGGLGIMAFTSHRDFESGKIDTFYTSRPLMHSIRTGACMLTCYRRYRKPSAEVLENFMIASGKMLKKWEGK